MLRPLRAFHAACQLPLRARQRIRIHYMLLIGVVSNVSFAEQGFLEFSSFSAEVKREERKEKREQKQRVPDLSTVHRRCAASCHDGMLPAPIGLPIVVCHRIAGRVPPLAEPRGDNVLMYQPMGDNRPTRASSPRSQENRGGRGSS